MQNQLPLCLTSHSCHSTCSISQASSEYLKNYSLYLYYVPLRLRPVSWVCSKHWLNDDKISDLRTSFSNNLLPNQQMTLFVYTIPVTYTRTVEGETQIMSLYTKVQGSHFFCTVLLNYFWIEAPTTNGANAV